MRTSPRRDHETPALPSITIPRTALAEFLSPFLSLPPPLPLSLSDAGPVGTVPRRRSLVIVETSPAPRGLPLGHRRQARGLRETEADLQRLSEAGHGE